MFTQEINGKMITTTDESLAEGFWDFFHGYHEKQEDGSLKFMEEEFFKFLIEQGFKIENVNQKMRTLTIKELTDEVIEYNKKAKIEDMLPIRCTYSYMSYTPEGKDVKLAGEQFQMNKEERTDYIIEHSLRLKHAVKEIFGY